MTQLDVVTMGETMVSLRTSTPLRLGGTMTMTAAGAESNVAIGLARLGYKVRWGGRVGADEIGAFILRTLRAESVAVDTVMVDPGRPTGLMLAERRVADISRVSYYRTGSAGSALASADAAACLADTPRILHLTGITPALSGSAAEAVVTAVALARQAGALVSVDVNYRSSLWVPREARRMLSELVRDAHIVIASEDELGLRRDRPAGRVGGSRRALCIRCQPARHQAGCPRCDRLARGTAAPRHRRPCHRA
jgi:2-dehydro-3-deoxygluconokinase